MTQLAADYALFSSPPPPPAWQRGPMRKYLHCPKRIAVQMVQIARRSRGDLSGGRRGEGWPGRRRTGRPERLRNVFMALITDAPASGGKIRRDL